MRAHQRRRAFTLVELLAVVIVIGILGTVGIAKYRVRQEKVREGRAIIDLQGIMIALSLREDDLPATLAEIGRGDARDPWGNLYVYFRFDPNDKGDPKGARKDKALHPINSRFDLYSMGPDGSTALPLTTAAAQDDIVVANDGKYVGRASGY